jgi:hypothetical protein
MDARHAVLLIPSKPSGPPQLPFRQFRTQETHLESTLTEIFASVASKRLTQTLNTLESTLAKKPGEGALRVAKTSICAPLFSARLQQTPLPLRGSLRNSPLITRHSPLPPKRSTQKLVSLAVLCPKTQNPPLAFQPLAHSSAIFCTFLHRFYFPPLCFQSFAHSFALLGGGGGVLI